MRLQDKLITLHERTQHPALGRYLVRELERVVPAFDSARVVALLASQTRAPDPGTAIQAHRTALRFLPRFAEARFGPGERLRSVVTGSREAEQAAAPFGEVPLRVISLLARPALEVVFRRLDALPPHLAARAAAALWRFVDTDVENALDRLVSRPQAGPVAALALAKRTAGRDPARAFERIAPRAPFEPELLLALAEVDLPERVAAALGEQIDTLKGAVPAAIALERLPPAARRELVLRTFATPRGWGAMHLLASLARGGSAEEVKLVSAFLERQKTQMVRVEAARCLGRIGDPAACASLIARHVDAPEATAALDGLLRQAIPDGQREALFGPALASRDPEALAFACLGLAGVDPDRAAGGVRELLTGTTEARVHGAHLLGYLPGAATIRLLSKLVTRDPEAAVRRQAAISLASQPPSPALAGAVMDLVGLVEPALTPILAHALAHARETADPAVLELLAITLKACPAGHRAPILEAIGAVDLPEARALVQAELGGRPDPDVLLGALGACATSALYWPESPARAYLAHREPQVAARAALAVLAEDPRTCVDTLARLLGGDDDAVSAALDALATVGSIAESCLAHPRYRELVKFVEATAKGPDYAGWAARQLALPELAYVPPAPDAVGHARAGELGAAIEDELAEGGGAARSFIAAALDPAAVDRLGDAHPVVEAFWAAVAAGAVVLFARWLLLLSPLVR